MTRGDHVAGGAGDVGAGGGRRAGVAVFLLYRDMVQRELDPQHLSTAHETPEADTPTPPARPVTGAYRWWGIVATAVFVVLVALRFLVLGA